MVDKNLNHAKYPDNIKYPTQSNFVAPVENTVRREPGEDEDEPECEAFELNLDVDDDDEVQSFSELWSDEEDEEYQPEERPVKKQKVEKEPIKQTDTTNFIKIFNLSSEHAEFLASFFKRYAEVEPGFRVTEYRNKTAPIRPLFKVIGKTVILKDIKGYLF